MKTFYENDTITPVTQEHITEGENKQQEGKVIKNEYVSFLVFFGVVLFLAAMGYVTSSNTELVIAAILALLLTLTLIQTLIQRRVARMMNTKINDLQQTMSATAISGIFSYLT